MITGTSADTIDTSLFVFTLIFVPCHIYYVNQSLLSHQPCFQQRQATVSVNKLINTKNAAGCFRYSFPQTVLTLVLELILD